VDDQAIAQSRTVAALAVKRLRLQQDVGSFLSSYTATVISQRVLAITSNARSSSDAVRRANAVAQAYLQYRRSQLQTQQQLLVHSNDDAITQARETVQNIGNEIGQVTTLPVSRSQQLRLRGLRTDLAQAKASLTATKANAAQSEADGKANTATQIENSEVLDRAAALPHHRL